MGEGWREAEGRGKRSSIKIKHQQFLNPEIKNNEKWGRDRWRVGGRLKPHPAESGWGCPGLQVEEWWHHKRRRIKWKVNKLRGGLTSFKRNLNAQLPWHLNRERVKVTDQENLKDPHNDKEKERGRKLTCLRCTAIFTVADLCGVSSNYINQTLMGPTLFN